MRILVVEDDEKIASFLVKGLKQNGYAVDHRADGEQGLALAQTVANLAVDLLGTAGVLGKGGPDAVDRGKWTRLYAFQRYSTIGGGSTEVQKNIIADRAIALPRRSTPA